MSVLKEKLKMMFSQPEGTWEYEYRSYSSSMKKVRLSGFDVLRNLMYGETEDFNKVKQEDSEYAGIEATLVESYGGEDKGTEYYSVFKFEAYGETAFVRFDGYYQSHYGTDFQEWNFVKPVQQMITAYVKE